MMKGQEMSTIILIFAFASGAIVGFYFSVLAMSWRIAEDVRRKLNADTREYISIAATRRLISSGYVDEVNESTFRNVRDVILHTFESVNL
jgi:hypothetical protein